MPAVNSPCQGELENGTCFRKSSDSSSGKSNPNLSLRSRSVVWAHNLLNFNAISKSRQLFFYDFHSNNIMNNCTLKISTISSRFNLNHNHTMHKRHKSLSQENPNSGKTQQHFPQKKFNKYKRFCLCRVAQEQNPSQAKSLAKIICQCQSQTLMLLQKCATSPKSYKCT